ncbi:MAG: PBP1A family penicillin-binding protein [Clostridia bacterium]|nr:PBP1A family penicillin-binding protein [Clostridia bacterium]
MKKTVKIIAIFSFIFLILGICAIAFFSSSIYGLGSQVSFDKNVLIKRNAKIGLYDDYDNFIETTSITEPVIKLEELPSYVKNAFISIEDKKFYSHSGLNYGRMAKAFVKNLTSGYAKEGASTISQQLIKNTYLTSEKTFNRKIKEVMLTLKLEKEFSKDDILETYLNVIYFGNSSYGIESASKTYFNKEAKDLSLAEAATLAAIIKSPRNYSPFYNLENSEKRRNLVLSEMLKDGYISTQDYQTAKNSPITTHLNDKEFYNKRIYEKAALDEASKLLNLSEKDLAVSGLKIFTYMDKKLQDKTEELILNKDYYHQNSYGNIADSGTVVIDNKTGGINAFYGKSNYNLVNMRRAPGSAIKPILVYAPALEYGKISPTTPIFDEAINIAGYTPTNVGNNFYGWVTARNTVEKSLNIPAIKIMQYVGLERAKEFATHAGIEFNEKDIGYSIALGGFTDGVSLIELTNSYLPFANNGNFIEAKFVKKIEDENGRILYERKIIPTKIMSEETAYLMTDMLISGVKYGTSQKLKTLKFEVAGKTGTVGIQNSNNNSDAWSVAYTPEKSIGVWLGNSTGEQEMQLESSNNGGTYASMLLRDIFEAANNGKKGSFITPNGIVKQNIDLIELKENNKVMLASENTPEMYVLEEVFNKKFAPKAVSTSFDSLSKPILSLKVKDNVSYLTFNANSYVIYEIYRVQEDETKLIETIKNKNGQVEIIDKDIEEDAMYSYYVLAKQVNNLTGKVVTSAESNYVKALISNKTNDIASIIEQIKAKAEDKLKATKKKKRIINWFNVKSIKKLA